MVCALTRNQSGDFEENRCLRWPDVAWPRWPLGCSPGLHGESASQVFVSKFVSKAPRSSPSASRADRLPQVDLWKCVAGRGLLTRNQVSLAIIGQLFVVDIIQAAKPLAECHALGVAGEETMVVGDGHDALAGGQQLVCMVDAPDRRRGRWQRSSTEPHPLGPRAATGTGVGRHMAGAGRGRQQPLCMRDGARNAVPARALIAVGARTRTVILIGHPSASSSPIGTKNFGHRPSPKMRA